MFIFSKQAWASEPPTSNTLRSPERCPALAAPQQNRNSPPTIATGKDTEETHFPLGTDIPKTFNAPLGGYDYVKRDVMIPMRDGIKLHTVIVVPKGANPDPLSSEPLKPSVPAFFNCFLVQKN